LKEIYWISEPSPGRLAIMPCPNGGDWLEDHVRRLRADGVDILVSLLSLREAAYLDLLEEAAVCQANGITCLSFPIQDRTAPHSKAEVADFAGKLVTEINEGKAVAIHCRAGIGRSSLMAACVLVINGMPSDQAFDRIRAARECDVPDTPIQRVWVTEFEEHMHSNRR
jgi:protein-tyrosine phosphatase